LSAEKNIMPFDYVKDLKKVSNYSSKDKSISVIIPVVLKEYFKMDEYNRMKKICDDTIYAVKMIEERVKKKKLDVKIEKLLKDLKEANDNFLENYKAIKDNFDSMKENYIKMKEGK
jgi:hypothetical protein